LRKQRSKIVISIPYSSETRKVGLVRVMTLEEQELANRQGVLIESLFPSIKVTSRCIENQPRGIYDAETERIAEPKIVKVAKELKREGAEVVIISCAADPALGMARDELEIPVIGAGSATAAVALSLGQNIGVIGIGEGVPEAMAEILGDRLASYEKIERVKTALDLQLEGAREQVLQAARNLVARSRVDVIAFGCAGLSTLDVDDLIEKEFGVYTVNPVIASGVQALYGLMRRRWEGAHDYHTK